MHDVTITPHATFRYMERFAGNLSPEAARQRLQKLLSRARFLHVCAGKARLYVLGEMRFVVDQQVLVTVYRRTYKLAEPEEDWYCLAV